MPFGVTRMGEAGVLVVDAVPELLLGTMVVVKIIGAVAIAVVE